MRRVSKCTLILLAILTLSACSLVVDFDRSLLLDASVDGSIEGGVGGSAGAAGAGGEGAGGSGGGAAGAGGDGGSAGSGGAGGDGGAATPI